MQNSFINKDDELTEDICYFVDDSNNINYPFDISKSYLLLNYFYHHKDKFEARSTIIISNTENLPLEKNVISDFVSYCQLKDIEITISNACQLNMLSKQFLIKNLEDKTKRFINENHSKLVIESLLYERKSMSSYIEDILVNHLSEYITKENFKLLPYDYIYRIITKHKSTDVQIEEQIKDFLMDYSELHPCETAVILAELDFPFSNKDYILKISDKCSQYIHIISPKLFKIVFEIYKKTDAKEIENDANMLKIKEKDNFDEETKTLRLSNKRMAIHIGEFSMRNDIENVIIPGSIKTIAESAFSGCTSIKTVIIESGCQIIGNQAFSNCSSLVKIQIPSTVKHICSRSFSDCKSLKYIELPNLKVINNGLFYGCSELKNINIPDSVTIIEDEAFKSSGLDIITIPDSVESIGASAFRSCLCLTDATLSKSIKEISPSLFIECHNLLNVNIPDNVTIINSYAFHSCYNLKSISIPCHVKVIGKCAFYYCSSLSEIIIPKSVQKIYSNAFVKCSSLKIFEIPKDIKPIDGEFLDTNVVPILK